MLAFPGAIPVVKPVAEMVAKVGSELAQVTWVVMSSTVPSEMVPVALNCWVLPVNKLATTVRDNAMETNFGPGIFVTTFTGGLAIPDSDAVISVFPTLTAATEPIEEMVAMFGSELLQVTWKVTSCFEPSS